MQDLLVIESVQADSTIYWDSFISIYPALREQMQRLAVQGDI